nr:MAG TPA: hypothetical protein [Caudoviricetes sp.]
MTKLRLHHKKASGSSQVSFCVMIYGNKKYFVV